MGKGMKDKGMGTDRRLNSLAPIFPCRRLFFPNRPCEFHWKRLQIAVDIAHRPHNCRHFRGAVR
jgi:hypothetical protein